MDNLETKLYNMKWYEYLITTGIPTIAIIWVGYILKEQIKSQKSVIGIYEGLVNATSPEKIIALQKREIEQLTNITSTDIQEIKTQVYQLAAFAVHSIEIFEKHNKTLEYLGKLVSFNKVAWINLNMPNCMRIINEIQESRQTNEDSANQ